jgi:hypothetical protein
LVSDKSAHLLDREAERATGHDEFEAADVFMVVGPLAAALTDRRPQQADLFVVSDGRNAGSGTVGQNSYAHRFFPLEPQVA